MTTSDFTRLHDQLDQATADHGFAGRARVTRRGAVLFDSSHGWANRADQIPVGPSTRFATASASKMFTAVAVVSAALDGLVSLQAPVTQVLPPERRPTTLSPDVTVHHLLTHTSGIADYFEEDEDLPGYQDDYGALWRELPVSLVRSDAALLPLFSDLPPVCPPGQEYHYSNAGYVLLGIVLAEVTGQAFADAMQQRVFDPAGMTTAGYPANDEVHPDLATGYLPPATDGGPWRTNIFSVPAVGGGDGGAVCTPVDIEAFLRGLHTGAAWGEELSKLVLTRYADIGGYGWWQGYGVEIRDGAFGKDGGDPGVYALTRFLPHTETTAVLLANVDEESVPQLDDLAELLVTAAEAAG